MKVLKFGGSSVAKPERILSIVNILKSYYAEGEHFTVIFSAFGGVTDSLIEMSNLAARGDRAYLGILDAFCERHTVTVEKIFNEDFKNIVLPHLERNHEVLRNLLHGVYLVREASLRTMDYVLSFGERNSAFIIAHALQQAGIKSAYLDARKVIKTDKQFGAAKVDFKVTYEKVHAYYAEHPEIQIVTGFIASAKGGLTTTLGRGGSDYTAALIAAGLSAKVIEIWTDVDGVLTADPRKVKKAFTIQNMTYAEAMEMSHFGAKVIYPPTLQPALQKQIPLYIKNTFNPTFRGTYISNVSDPNGTPVKGISSINKVALLTLSGSGLFGVPGIAGRLFSSLAQASINVILITQGSSENSISFAIDPQAAKKAKNCVEEAFQYELDRGVVDKVKVEEDLSVIAIIGENMRYRPGISGRLFQALGKNGINIIAIAQGSSELNISVVIPQTDESKALNALHEAFFLSDTRVLHLFIVGVGLIGGTLLEQIRAQAEFLREKRALEIKVIGLANTKKMIFDPNGLDLANWKKDLSEGDHVSDLPIFIARMKEMNLTNSIFVDNTANERVANYYESILDNSISISTPNKFATSSSFLQYQRLKTIANSRGVAFRYETNVGAGLPVISTLNDLIDSGDEILKIQGVLSGSLSFIFNHFDGQQPFSAIVEEARKRGYTEPDPRTDLSGADVRRKILILAREAGLSLESDQVHIEPILPPVVQNATSVADFFTQLVANNDYFEGLRADAEKAGKVLRMIATLNEKGTARIALEAVGTDSPFYFLSGSDNMIVFVTERYKERPLVVRGPGAGAEVTAAGVFAEIISIGKYLS
jgi:bifunctional aspartokinase / homoserine dehydrogenase 1